MGRKRAPKDYSSVCKAGLKTGKREREKYTITEKYHAVIEMEDGATIAQVQRKYNAAKGTVATWRKNREKIKEAMNSGKHTGRARARDGKFPKIDEGVLRIIKDQRARAQPVPLSGGMIKAIGRQVAIKLGEHKWKPSEGWLTRFVKRNQLSHYRLAGERQSAPDVGTWVEDNLVPLMKR